MNLQTNETIDYVTNEDNSEQDFLAFADLELTDEQLSAVKGGPFGCSWCTTIGNHNETIAEDGTEGEADLLDFTDLRLTEEQLAGVKGGPSTNDSRAIKITASTANMAPGQHLNHNETAAEDDEAESEMLDDLTVENDAQVKGGPNGFGGLSLNHNETTVEDDVEEITLDDLIVSAAQDDAVKGGCAYCGGIKLNHNETTAEDAEAEAEELNDLLVNDNQQAEVKGGGITKLGSRRLILQGDGTYA